MRVKLRLAAVSNMRTSPHIGMMTLVDDIECRALVITCDNNVREQLSVRLDRGPSFSKKWLPEVMWRVLRDMGADQFEIQINGLMAGEYLTDLVCTATGQRLGEYLTDLVCTATGQRFPIRASDAILLAYVANLPVYADKTLMDRQSSPWKPNALSVAMPVNVIDGKVLRSLLDDAVRAENYELASKIRDELKSREKSERDDMIEPEI